MVAVGYGQKILSYSSYGIVSLTIIYQFFRATRKKSNSISLLVDNGIAYW